MALNGNDLGDQLKAAVMAVVNTLNQSSNPVNASAYQTALFRAWGNTIVDYFKANATINPLTVTMTPNDGSPHTHSPSATDTATGKIS